MSALRILARFAGALLSIAAMTPLTAQPRNQRVIFFRQQNAPQIVFQRSDTSYCHVQSQRQMATHGGIGLFRDLPVQTPRGTFTGICPWPNGLYSLGDDPIVYALRGEFEAGAIVCRINPTQLDRVGGVRLVRALEPDADLLRERQDIGLCTD
jgi:hypothetical protein